jgi:hypothetical protein
MKFQRKSGERLCFAPAFLSQRVRGVFLYINFLKYLFGELPMHVIQISFMLYS